MEGGRERKKEGTSTAGHSSLWGDDVLFIIRFFRCRQWMNYHHLTINQEDRNVLSEVENLMTVSIVKSIIKVTYYDDVILPVGVTLALPLDVICVTYFRTLCLLSQMSFLVCAARCDPCSALFIITYVSRLKLLGRLLCPASATICATFTASSFFLGIFVWGEGVKLRGHGVVLGGGSIFGVSLSGLSIVTDSTAGDLEASLYSLLCRSLAAVWGSGVLPEEAHPRFGTENKIPSLKKKENNNTIRDQGVFRGITNNNTVQL